MKPALLVLLAAAAAWAQADEARREDRRDSIAITDPQATSYRFGDVRVMAPQDPPRPPEARQAEARSGRPFDPDLVRDDALRLLAAYRDMGRYRAAIRIDTSPDPGDRTLDVTYAVEPGPLILLDTLIIRNVRGEVGRAAPGLTSPSLLRSLAPLAPGDTLRAEALHRVSDRLERTGLFSLARFSDSLGDAPSAPGTERRVLILDAAEKTPGMARMSLRWETGAGIGVNSAIGHRNLGGRFWEARLDGTLAMRRQDFSIGLGRPLAFGLPFRIDALGGYRSRQDIGAAEGLGADWFTGEEAGFAALWASHSPLAWLSVAMGSAYRAVRVDRGLQAPFRGEGASVLAGAEASLLDHAMNPSRGVRMETGAGLGGPLPGRASGEGQGPHAWGHTTLSGYLPAGGRESVLAGRIGGGTFLGKAGLEADRFFLGGPGNLRGFREGEVCPEREIVETRNGPAGICGRTGLEPAYLLGSAEWRAKPIRLLVRRPQGLLATLKELRLLPFADAGLVWNRRAGGPGGGRWAAALGMGFQYPVMGFVHVRMDLAALRQEGAPWSFGWLLDLNQAF